MSDNLSVETARNAFAALVPALGTPERTRINRVHEDGAGVRGFHPVYSLAMHSRGNDNYDSSGYAGNASRGDSMSIPGWLESGGVAVLDIGFHKGDTMIELVTFPEANAAVRQAAAGFLDALETR